MDKDQKTNLLGLLEKWAKYVGLIAIIISGLAYSKNSFWLSIATIIIGWLLISSWLIVVIQKKSSTANILLPPGTSVDKPNRLYPTWARLTALLSIFLITMCTAIWSCLLVVHQVRTSIFPLDSVSLPIGEYPGLSMTTEPGPLWLWVGIVNKEIDRSKFTTNINSSNIVKPGEYSPRVAEVGRFSVVHIYVTGTSDDGPLTISNKLPVKILSYKPIANPTDLVGIPIGGGDDYWIFSSDITSESINNTDNIVWATYPSDIKEQVQKSTGFQTKGKIPSELERAVNEGIASLPDFFSLSKDEMISFSVALNFKEPGIYKVDFGVEYIYKGHKSIAWIDSPLVIYVPSNYYLWNQIADDNQYSLDRVCTLPLSFSSIAYECIDKSAENFKMGTTALSLAPDSTAIAYGQYDGTVSIRNLSNGKETASIGKQYFQITSVALGNKREIVAIASGEIQIWDTKEQKELIGFGANSGIVKHLVFSPDDTILASSTDRIKLWDTNGNEITEFKIDNVWVNDIAFSPNGETLSAAYSDGSIVMWDIRSSTPTYFQAPNSSSVQTLVYSQNGELLVTANSNGEIVVWRMREKSKLITLSSDATNILSVSISPDSTLLATAGEDGRIKIWNMQNSSLIQTFEMLLNFPISLKFSTDNTRLVVLTPLNLMVWDTKSWERKLDIDLLQAK